MFSKDIRGLQEWILLSNVAALDSERKKHECKKKLLILLNKEDDFSRKGLMRRQN